MSPEETPGGAAQKLAELSTTFRATGSFFGDRLKNVLNRDALFDLGGEAMNLVVPGGAIAVKLTKAIADRRREGKR